MTGESVKLTLPQRVLLDEVGARPDGLIVSTSYAPAKALARLGLAEWKAGTFADRLLITPAGRLALTGKPEA